MRTALILLAVCAAGAPAAAARADQPAALQSLALSRFAPADAVGASPLAALAEAPADYLASRTALGSPERFAAFLRDARWTDAFMRGRPTRLVLGTPALVRALARPTVARAFVATPAMRDPRLVGELVRGKLFRKLCSLASVKAVLGDDAAMGELVAAVRPWLDENPEAARALAARSPGAAAALKR